MSLQLRPQATAWQTTFISLLALTAIILAPHATPQNVTLISFTATSLSGLPEIYVEWETATQFETVGFFVRRSDFAQGQYVRVSDFIPREGDDLTGWQYTWIDETTVLGHTYFYRLEEITTNQISIFYWPVVATAGSPIPVLPFNIYLPLVARSN